ncbi:MAG TPA: DUF4390 domain-containing protein [Candidatus Saccharimonadales bacterium]|nr:DUF4390 domain-containing protein [Candidatus Saccharimonadales bacterium]
MRAVRSTGALVAALIALLACPVLFAASPPEGAEIRDVQVRNTPSDLFVSFVLHGAFTDDIREQIRTGLPVTFTHYVEIVNKRTAWFDTTLVKKEISTTVTYDTLTRQYRLTRSVNGEMTETELTDRAAEMESFMTTVKRQRLCDPNDLPGDRRLSLRVKSRMRRRFVFFFIPWNLETSWARIGLSLPSAQEPPAGGSVP